jgi:hypothetical protein
MAQNAIPPNRKWFADMARAWLRRARSERDLGLAYDAREVARRWIEQGQKNLPRSR